MNDAAHNPATARRRRVELRVRGLVQGVGFRPFVYRLANKLGLAGSVCNNAQGVLIELEGAPSALLRFEELLRSDLPPLARIDSLEKYSSPPANETSFRIIESESEGSASVLVLPDVATCSACLSEIFDPQDRRYHYPFTNCTNCGPRISIIEALPYDRPLTTMREFKMCESCRAEYEDPANRRFHAQPNACPECGPQLCLVDNNGEPIAVRHEALQEACEQIRRGKIVALKGLGGFQLLVDARNEEAVQLLRRRKLRPTKPLAIMMPTLGLAEDCCELGDEEKKWLLSPQTPIVLLRCKPGSCLIAKSVAPHNPYLGVILPYTPLHHLLMRELGFPIVATSGNLSDEPICIANDEALARLGAIADLFLMHNRPIVRQMDDSVLQLVDGEPLLLRHGRGFAPGSRELPALHQQVLALGGHLKNSIAIGRIGLAILGQHIGDLETQAAVSAFKREVKSLQQLNEVDPELIAVDSHPDYYSSQYGATLGQPLLPVQHHLAHVLSCLAEHRLAPPIVGVAWDGTGLGTDGTIWGGEFILVEQTCWRRVAYLRQFSLPGGDAAARDPRRSALALLYEIYGDDILSILKLVDKLALNETELDALLQMLRADLNCPRTSSAGRLFDAVAALTGICRQSSFEGEAAMLLQFAAERSDTHAGYAFSRGDNGVLDWQPLIQRIIDDLNQLVPVDDIAMRFHRSLAHLIAQTISSYDDIPVVLSGGCFQNRLLLSLTKSALHEQGREVYSHHLVPPNDGGIAFGQLYAATLKLEERI